MAEKKPNKVLNSIVLNETITRRVLDPVQIITARCGAGHHRWAYRDGGGQACGYCGVRR